MRATRLPAETVPGTPPDFASHSVGRAFGVANRRPDRVRAPIVPAFRFPLWRQSLAVTTPDNRPSGEGRGSRHRNCTLDTPGARRFEELQRYHPPRDVSTASVTSGRSEWPRGSPGARGATKRRLIVSPTRCFASSAIAFALSLLRPFALAPSLAHQNPLAPLRETARMGSFSNASISVGAFGVLGWCAGGSYLLASRLSRAIGRRTNL